MLYERFAYWGRATPDAIALQALRQQLTYGQALRWVDALAGRFRAAGVRPGQRVALPGAEVAEQLCQFALDRLGAVATTGALDRPWVDWAIGSGPAADPKAISMGPLAAPLRGDAWAQEESRVAPHRWNAHDPCRIRPSSGSTGTPKWIQRSYASTLAGLDINRSLMRFGPGVVCAHGLGGAGPAVALRTNAWTTGSTLASLAPVGPQESAVPRLPLLASMKVDLLAISPGTLQIMLATGGGAVPHLPGLWIYFYGTRAPMALVDRVAREMTPHMVATYGSTECSNCMAAFLRPGEVQPHTVGHVLPGARIEVLARDRSRVAAPGETGLVRIRVIDPGHDGYVDDAGNLLPFDPADPEWFVPGDLGWFDEGGALHVLGRDDEVLNLGGLKMRPGDLEDAVQGLGLTSEQAAFTVVGEAESRAFLAVVLKPDTSQQQFRQALRTRLPALTSLGLVAMPKLPKLPTSKVDYQELRRFVGSLPRQGA